MTAFLTVVIHLTAVLAGSVMMAIRNQNTTPQTQGEAAPVTMPCPGSVSG